MINYMYKYQDYDPGVNIKIMTPGFLSAAHQDIYGCWHCTLT